MRRLFIILLGACLANALAAKQVVVFNKNKQAKLTKKHGRAS